MKRSSLAFLLLTLTSISQAYEEPKIDVLEIAKMFEKTYPVKTTTTTKRTTTTFVANPYCTTLPAVDANNIKGILDKCQRHTRLGGEPFDTIGKRSATSPSNDDVTQLFSGRTVVDMCLRIARTSYKELDLSSIERINTKGCKYDGEYESPLVIENNAYLEQLYLSPKLSVNNQEDDEVIAISLVRKRKKLPLIRIRNNPKLKTIKTLKLAFKEMNAEILEEGECVLKKEIGSFKEIESCKILSGDVVLSKAIEPYPPHPLSLKEIQGCIKIEGTKLESLKFLENVTIEMRCADGVHVIRNNKNLCVGKRFLNDVYFDIKNNMHPSCETACKAALAENLTDYHECKIILGNVKIAEWDGAEADLIAAFSNVEEIYGQLILANTNLKSTAELFKSLRKIKNNELDGPALVIENNRDLNIIEMRSLEVIRSMGEPVVIIRQPNAKMTRETYYKLQYRTIGGVHLDAIVVDKNKGGLIVDYVIYGILLIIVNIAGIGGFIFTFIRLKRKNSEEPKITKVKLRTASQAKTN